MYMWAFTFYLCHSTSESKKTLFCCSLRHNAIEGVHLFISTFRRDLIICSEAYAYMSL